MDLPDSPDLNISLALLLSWTHLKYLCRASDQAFVNIAGLPLAGRTEGRGMQLGNFLLSLQQFSTHQFQFSISGTPQRPRSHGARLPGGHISVERFLSWPHGAVNGYAVTVLIRISATHQRHSGATESIWALQR